MVYNNKLDNPYNYINIDKRKLLCYDCKVVTAVFLRGKQFGSLSAV